MLIQNLTELEELHLDGVNISTPGKEWGRALSSSLPHLRVLSLVQCSLFGPIDQSLAKLHSLSVIRLDDNNLFASVLGFFSKFSNLTSLSLKDCCLNGTFPNEIFQVSTLQTLVLSYNMLLEGSFPESSQNNSLQSLLFANTNFTGSLSTSIDNNFTEPIPSFNMSKNLTQINLPSNGLTGSISSGLLNLEEVDLGINFLKGNIPSTFFALPSIKSIQLRFNQFSGQVVEFPNAAFSLMESIDLRSNDLNGIQEPYSLGFLSILDLHFNQLRGKIPILPSCAVYIDLSSNYFTSSIPADIGKYLSITMHFSLSENNLTGVVPKSICNAMDLQFIDLSNNGLTGRTPACILAMSQISEVNLRSNNLSGKIPDAFPVNCHLDTLDLNGNLLTGRVPKSLSHCTRLGFVDLGSNMLLDAFPVSLKNISTLRILVLRSNKFYGNITCKDNIAAWPMIQIFDVAFNDFSGEIPGKCLTKELPQWDNSRITIKTDIPSTESFLVNEGLCGPPLTSNCSDGVPRKSPETPKDSHSNSGLEIEWNVISF
ncbi:hypothetical protein FNV43_RR08827 [Rhamnella rubrinervis]|uniref:Uncharacterized protein n=1 Tax=Rhamnella rubrinervis TaxID=2594499 RepID=A0A8K0MJF2_9ROSA|nr:hypothetical protein FNV43_RR08827 [Rhamnella rubrinervis]